MRLSGMLVLWLAAGSFGHAFGDSYTLDAKASLLGAVVYKGGFGAALAHNHLVFARKIQKFELSIPDATKPEGGTFAASVNVSDVASDDPENTKTWTPRLEELGLVTKDTFSEVKESDRKDIEQTLQGKDQLDGAKFPSITAQLQSLTPGAGSIGSIATTHRAKISVGIHGVTKEVEWPAQVKVEGDTATVVTSGPLKFTDFGIKPISIGFGAIQNRDEFKMVVNLIARKDARQ